MTLARRESAEKRMRQKWYEFVMAEQQGASLQTLERMFSSYMLSLEEYNHSCEEDQSALQFQNEALPAPAKRRKTA